MDSHILEEVNSIKDLRIVFESKFEFKLNLETITVQAFRLLGFVSRATKEFRDVESIISIYRSLVLSKLLFELVI